jgi:tetratricopeptide (TPR) repeat protein
VLFDLQSPRRRRVVKFVYGGLALLLGAGLIAGTFGSGGGNGSILDTLFGGGGGGSASSAFDDQIKQAEQKLAVNPQDRQALISLVNLHIQAGNQKVDVDQSTGQTVPTADSADEYNKAADAWNNYLKTKPAKPNPGAALQMASGFFALAQLSTSSAEAQGNLEDAAKAQQIAVDDNPSFGAYAALAQYQYLAGETAAGDESIKQAKALNPAQANALDQLVAQIKKVSENFQNQVAADKKATKKGETASGTSGSNPFAGLGSSGGLGGSGLGQ